MKAIIEPRPLCGTIEAAASKSEAHRLLILSALADKPTRLLLSGVADDIAATADCISALGAGVMHTAEGLLVVPAVEYRRSPLLNCRESGTTLRLLLPIAAAIGSQANFCGEGRLPVRPISGLINAMREKGISFTSETLPFSILGKMRHGSFRISGNVSSQYISGLLLALPLLEGRSKIELTSLTGSQAYVNLTRAIQLLFGVESEKSESGYVVSGSQHIRTPGVVNVGGDWSNAAIMLTAGVLGGGVTVTGLDAASQQGDKHIVSLLRRFGACVKTAEGSVTALSGTLHGCDISINQTPDLLPPLCIAAAYADGITRFSSGERLRLKESDRLRSCAQMINALGGNAAETTDGLIVHGGGLHGGSVDGCGDHRIVMSAAVAATVCSSTVYISGAQAVEKSYPGFFKAFTKLGGIAEFMPDESDI